MSYLQAIWLENRPTPLVIDTLSGILPVMARAVAQELEALEAQ